MFWVYFEYPLDLKGCSRGGPESGSKVFWTLKHVSVKVEVRVACA